MGRLTFGILTLGILVELRHPLIHEDVNCEKLTVKKWWIFGADFSRFTQSFSRFIRDINGEKKNISLLMIFFTVSFSRFTPSRLIRHQDVFVFNGAVKEGGPLKGPERSCFPGCPLRGFWGSPKPIHLKPGHLKMAFSAHGGVWTAPFLSRRRLPCLDGAFSVEFP